MSAASVITLHNVTKQFARPPAPPFTALCNINLSIAPGEFVALLGKSGSGKSTLLNLITGLDQPTQGEVQIADTTLQRLSENKLALWRGKSVGVVFQFFQLLPTLTVLENILLAMDFNGALPRPKRKERAKHLLDLVGIAEQADKLPATLSGGQQQRAAIARALANDPPLLVADEPTGNLDTNTADAVLTLFSNLAKQGKTLLIVTHDEDLAKRAGRIVRLADGAIISDEVVASHRGGMA